MIGYVLATIAFITVSAFFAYYYHKHKEDVMSGIYIGYIIMAICNLIFKISG